MRNSLSASLDDILRAIQLVGPEAVSLEAIHFLTSTGRRVLILDGLDELPVHSMLVPTSPSTLKGSCLGPGPTGAGDDPYLCRDAVTTPEEPDSERQLCLRLIAATQAWLAFLLRRVDRDAATALLGELASVRWSTNFQSVSTEQIVRLWLRLVPSSDRRDGVLRGLLETCSYLESTGPGVFRLVHVIYLKYRLAWLLHSALVQTKHARLQLPRLSSGVTARFRKLTESDRNFSIESAGWVAKLVGKATVPERRDQNERLASVPSHGLGPTISDAELARSDLSGFGPRFLRVVSFAGASLRSAALEESDVRDASLARAVLTSARVVGANQPGADLRDAALRGVHLNDATLTEVNMPRANVAEARLNGVDLGNAGLPGTGLDPRTRA